MSNDPLKDLTSVNEEVNAKKKVKEQEYQIKSLEKELSVLKARLDESPTALTTLEVKSIYVNSVWNVVVEALLRQTFSVPGSINPNNSKAIETVIERTLKIADIAVRAAENHEKLRDEEDKALAAARANKALREMIPQE
jgi:uncharacterized protein YjgD (DUF1641 family)